MKMTLLAILPILPNWNSLDSVRHAHSDLELAGLVFFALLVIAEAAAHNSKQEERKHLFDSIGIWFFAAAIVCEIAGYWYGQRNDALSGQVIVSLDSKAQDAATNAAAALVKSGTALSESKDAESKAGDAVIKSDEAGTKAGMAIKAATGADHLVHDAEKKLDTVDAKRAELEQSLRNMATCTAPRVIPHWQWGFTTFFDPLKPYKDWNALIEYVPNDAETLRAVSNLNDALSSAGWHVTAKPIGELFDGVEIRGFEFPNARQKQRSGEMATIEHEAQDVASAVVRYLHSYNWDAKRGWPSDSDRDTDLIPQKGIRIRVGLYPPITFTAPPAMKGWAEETAKQNEQRRQKIKKTEDDLRKAMMPEEYALHEQLLQLDKKLLDPAVSTCQPLEPLFPSFFP